MARYNRWQNGSLYKSAGGLSDEERRRDLGAFFGSIHATLNHLLWADQIWMHRFAGTAAPPAKSPRQSVESLLPWNELETARRTFDETILSWTETLDQAWLESDLTWYSGAAGREMRRPRWRLVTHFFNHQTHHRGQVHAMLTRLGAKPEDTDLMLID
jgi:uncharacterized damage-inducible protein DinB